MIAGEEIPFPLSVWLEGKGEREAMKRGGVVGMKRKRRRSAAGRAFSVLCFGPWARDGRPYLPSVIFTVFEKLSPVSLPAMVTVAM